MNISDFVELLPGKWFKGLTLVSVESSPLSDAPGVVKNEDGTVTVLITFTEMTQDFPVIED